MEFIKSMLQHMEMTRLTVPFVVVLSATILLCIVSCIIAAKDVTYKYKKISIALSAVIAVLIVCLILMKFTGCDRVIREEYKAIDTTSMQRIVMQYKY